MTILKDSKIELLESKLKNALSDFESLKRNSQKEIAKAKQDGREEILLKFFPIIDNIMRAKDFIQKSKSVESVSNGFKIILNQFTVTLKDLDVRAGNSLGFKFDPNKDEAVQMVKSIEPSGTVVEELRPAYFYEDRLIRAAQVIVAK